MPTQRSTRGFLTRSASPAFLTPGALAGAEGAVFREDVEVVDPHRPRADAAGHALGPGDVAGDYPAGQAVDGIVGDGHGFVVAVVLDDANDRAEDLFLRDAHLVVDVGDAG